MVNIELYQGPYVAATPIRTLQFVAGPPAQIISSSGSFYVDSFTAGTYVGIRGTANNDGIYLIDSVSALTLTMDAGVVFAPEGPFAAAASIHDMVDHLYDKHFFYAGGNLIEMIVTRISDGAYVQKFYTYRRNKLQQISLQEPPP